jgi:hypothetical protein
VQTAKGTLYKIAVIADPDTDSKVPDKTHVWRSFVLKGSLYWDGPNQKVDLVWENDHNEIRYSGFLIKITINSFYCIHSVSFDFGKQVAERQFSIKLDGAKNFIQKQPK